MTSGRGKALALSAALIGWSFTAGIQHPWRRHPLVQAALGTALAAATRAPLGLRPPQVRSGLRLGLTAAGVVAAGVSAAGALPGVRTAMAARELPPQVGHWLAVEIPLGTVWSEETAFRAALASVAADGFGPSGGRLLQAATFGLTHVPDALGTGEPLLGTVVATGLAGWAFGLLAERSGSVLAPMLAHLAINEAGALAALAVQRRTRAGR
ncbi:MAG: Rv0804 family intramembrane glutamic endopeptidase [Mycobacterium sp.]